MTLFEDQQMKQCDNVVLYSINLARIRSFLWGESPFSGDIPSLIQIDVHKLDISLAADIVLVAHCKESLFVGPPVGLLLVEVFDHPVVREYEPMRFLDSLEPN